MAYYLKTLGQLALRQHGPDGAVLLANSKSLAVAALLATMPDRSARREHLAALLWPQVDSSRARRSLRQALFHISKKADAHLIQATDSRLYLDPALVKVDLWEFEEALRAEDYARAVELYDGPFVPGLERKGGTELEHWIESQDEQVRAGLEAAYTGLIGAALAEGDAETATGYARKYVELNPLNERAQLALVRSLQAAGDRVGALQAYRAYRALLREALEGEPSEELERIVAEVREEAIGAPAQPMGAGAADRPDGWRPWRWALLGGVTGAALASISAAILFSGLIESRSAEAPVVTAGLEGELYVQAESSGRSLLRGRLREGELRLEPTGLRIGEQPSPDGSLIAFSTEAPDGWNLAVRDAAGGRERVLTTDSDDELPVGWSPDGRRILYSQGVLLEGGRDYTHVLMVYDLETGRADTVSSLRASFWSRAAWSPDGTRIAFLADPDGEIGLYVVEADGSDPRLVAEGLADYDRPAWSPDSRRLAFTADRFGSGDIFSVSPEGWGLRRITDLPGEERNPVWLSSDVLAFVASDPGGERDLWALNVMSNQRQRLSARGDLGWIRGFLPGVRSESWIERVAIAGAPELVSPGQRLQMAVALADAAGRARASSAVPIRWSVSDPEVARFAAPGSLEIHGRGSFHIVASAGGWAADTLRVSSRRLEIRPVPLIFLEDWRQGIRDRRWSRFGEPLPYSRPSGGPEGGGIMVSNGDHHFHSGLVTRQGFNPKDGLTLEVWGRMPFTGQLYQNFVIELCGPDGVPGDGAKWQPYEPILSFDIEGPNEEDGPRASINVGGYGIEVPYPETPEVWRRYAIQLEPDGALSYLVDGQLRWRGASGLAVSELGPVHVALDGRSVGTEIAHGPFRVYAGERYGFEGEGRAPATTVMSRR